jgi:hypothetical protein
MAPQQAPFNHVNNGRVRMIKGRTKRVHIAGRGKHEWHTNIGGV